MKKIKEIKIVNQDESTEIADIGADAINVDYNDTTVKAELDKLNANDTSLLNTQTSQGNTLTNLQTQVSSLASGSPAGVYATVAALTSADPDHSKIYVVTENGHWYYYNNGWQDGGIYQATHVGEESISYFNLDNGLKNELCLSYDAINVIFEKGNISESTGKNTGASTITTLIRTSGYIEGDYIVINAETNYRYKVYRYQADETYIDVSNARLSGQTIITNTGNYKYRLACSKTDWSTMKVSESTNYTIKKINNNFYNDYIEFKKNSNVNINDILLSQYDNKILNIAYSGVGLAPTNSLEHFMLVCNMGFNSLKGDIRLTSDNKLIMCHDAGFTLNNDDEIISFDNSDYTPIHSLTYNQCMALSYNSFKSRAGHNCHVCDIDHYLQICKKYGKIPYITIRNEYLDDTIEILIQKLKFYKLKNKCIINSVGYIPLEAIREVDNELLLSYTLSSQTSATTQDVDKCIELTKCYLDIFAFPYNNAWDTIDNSYQAIAYAQNNGIPLLCAQINNMSDYINLIKHGFVGFHITAPFIDYNLNHHNFNITVENGIASFSNSLSGSKYTGNIDVHDNVIDVYDIALTDTNTSTANDFPDGVLELAMNELPYLLNICSKESQDVKLKWAWNTTHGYALRISNYDISINDIFYLDIQY